MSKQLRVLLPDDEMGEIRRLASLEGLTAGGWVRKTLREACALKPGRDPNTKLKAIRRSAQYSFPVSGVEQMNAEIEQGYLS
jgi:hypothetical protein